MEKLDALLLAEARRLNVAEMTNAERAAWYAYVRANLPSRQPTPRADWPKRVAFITLAVLVASMVALGCYIAGAL